MNQVLRAPDTDELGGNLHWHLEDLLKRTGRPPVAWLAEQLNSRLQRESEAGGSGFQAVSGHPRLSQYTAPLKGDADKNPEVEKAVDLLVDLALQNTAAGFYMHQYLADIDPGGVLVPELVNRRVASETNSETLRQLAKLISGYPVGSEVWRRASISFLEESQSMRSPDKERLYAAISYSGPTSWSGTPGQVPELFVSNVARARKQLEEEQDPIFKPYWEWSLEGAEAQLRYEEERAREDRGE
jgi:hypothetical protein